MLAKGSSNASMLSVTRLAHCHHLSSLYDDTSHKSLNCALASSMLTCVVSSTVTLLDI